MESTAGGGDKGIVGETIAHPKPTGGDRFVQPSATPAAMVFAGEEGKQGSKSRNQSNSSMSEKDVVGNPNLHSGPEVFTEGVIDEEDDDAVEVVLEEDEIAKAGQWTILAHFYSLRAPNTSALFEDMRRAWRLRADMSFKSLRDNLFIITFSAEGDYNFMLQGGPWIHRGDALLVAEFDGLTCPSKILLNSVPIWVRIYDLPLVLMIQARGKLYGSKLSNVREVDVVTDGLNKYDFFRIRVDLPVNHPLKAKIAIKVAVQGKEVTRSFDLRYERVPHFCFICGFLGHSDKECDKKVPNADHPFRFSADLRCSPLKPFERRIGQVKAFANAGVARNLIFKSAGSAGSSSSGKVKGDKRDEIIPPRVDAHDDFEGQEKSRDIHTDEQLAQQAQGMMVDSQVGMKGGTSGGVLGIHGFSVSHCDQSGSDSHSAQSLGMIPAIANLHQQASFGDVSSEDRGNLIKENVQALSAAQSSGQVQQAIQLFQQPSSV
ncbi:hypothetical protein OsJ_33665 [Oryza sativa Japonica Group]|uniref:CCHC-type domain-containing protein n=1 Tax=Oryza sativa subsp. japonica TaxID=39947 RepID=B9GAC9_ORYSJ|nr:hypothetical protein OsJ_33665 [Oryza sativa Japonica Group]